MISRCPSLWAYIVIWPSGLLLLLLLPAAHFNHETYCYVNNNIPIVYFANYGVYEINFVLVTWSKIVRSLFEPEPIFLSGHPRGWGGVAWVVAEW